MFLVVDGGTEIILSAVVMVDPKMGNTGKEYYKVHLSGGQHVTVFDSVITRDTFLNTWKTAVSP